MVEPIPKWVMVRYACLYNEFREEEFNRKKAVEVLEKEGLDGTKLVNTFFSELHKSGWVKTKKDSEDKRRKIFRLVGPEKAILKLEK